MMKDLAPPQLFPHQQELLLGTLQSSQSSTAQPRDAERTTHGGL
jgi:hypothetical protein